MMKKTIGLLASVALLSPGLALAGDGPKDVQAQSGQQPSGTAQTIQMHSQPQGQSLGDKEVTGTVVKRSGDELKLRTDNGIISFKVNKGTRFQDPTVKQARDIKEGQQVRTSFSVEKDTNIARSISLDEATGGSGLDTSEPGLHQDMGGSGLQQGLDSDPGIQGDVTGAQHSGDTGSGGKTY